MASPWPPLRRRCSLSVGGDPGYGFARHKGYPTPEHLAALDRLGPCSVHRRTFAPVAAALARMQGVLPIYLDDADL